VTARRSRCVACRPERGEATTRRCGEVSCHPLGRRTADDGLTHPRAFQRIRGLGDLGDCSALPFLHILSFFSGRYEKVSEVPSIAERASRGRVPALHARAYYGRLTILTQPVDRGTQSGVQRPQRSQYFPRRPNSSTPGRREPCRPPRRQCGHGSACRLPSMVTRMAPNATSMHTHPCEGRDDHTGGVLQGDVAFPPHAAAKTT